MGEDNKENPTSVHSAIWKLLARTFLHAYWKQLPWDTWNVRGGGWCSLFNSVLCSQKQGSYLPQVTSIQPWKHHKHWLWSKVLYKQDKQQGWWSCTTAKMFWQALKPKNKIKRAIYCALHMSQKALMSQLEVKSCSAPCQTPEMENIGPPGRWISSSQDLWSDGSH